MDAINKYLKETRNIVRLEDGRIYDGNRPRIVCNDGYSVSVQASRYHYCSPRIDGAEQYESVELLFPNMEDELINDYEVYSDYDDCNWSIYHYVPIEIVNVLIEKHGGIVHNEKGS